MMQYTIEQVKAMGFEPVGDKCTQDGMDELMEMVHDRIYQGDIAVVAQEQVNGTWYYQLMVKF